MDIEKIVEEMERHARDMVPTCYEHAPLSPQNILALIADWKELRAYKQQRLEQDDEEWRQHVIVSPERASAKAESAEQKGGE